MPANTTYPDALKSSAWDKKLAQPKLLKALAALHKEHETVSWARFSADALLRVARTATQLKEAVGASAKAWKSEEADLKKAAELVKSALKEARKALAKDTSALTHLKAIDDKLADYLKVVAGMAEELVQASKAALKNIEESDEDSSVDAAIEKLLDPARLAAQLMACRRDPVRSIYFGYVDASKDTQAELAVHPTTLGRTLFTKLVEATGVKAGSYGSLGVDGTTLRVRIDKAYSGLAKKLRIPIKRAGFRVVQILILDAASGKAFEEDQEDDPPPKDKSAPQTKPSTPPLDEKTFKLRATALAKLLQKSPDSPAAQLLKQASEAAKKGDWVKATDLLEQAMDVVDDIAPSKPKDVESGSKKEDTTPSRTQSPPPLLDEKTFKSRAMALAKLLQKSPDSPAAKLLKKANEAAKEEDWQGATDLLEEAMAIVDDTPAPQNNADETLAKALYGGDVQAMGPLKKAFDLPGRVALVHAFGGEAGLVAVRQILQDVCGGNPAKLRELVDALG